MVTTVMNIISNIILFVFAEKIYPYYYAPKKGSAYLKAAVITGISVLLALLHPIELKFINYVLVVLSINIYNKNFYKTEGYSYILFNTAALLFLLLTEFASVIIIPLITHETINEYLTEGNLLSSYLINWFIMFVIFETVYMMIKKRKEQIPSITLTGIAAYLLLFVFEIVMIGYTTKLASDEKTTTVLLVVLSGYFLINLLVAYLIFKSSRGSEVKYEYELLQQQATTQMTLYRDLLEKYEQSQEITHDVNRHLETLSGLLADKETKAEKYLSDFAQKIEQSKPQFKSKNAILDVIINHKILQSELKNIHFIVDYDDTDLDFISDMDITVILANVLDNAYEAVEKLDENHREVRLVINYMAGFVLINVSNNYAQVNREPDGKFLSTKKNHLGIGMKNVQRTVEKYDGIYGAEVKGDRFIVKITIPYVKKERSV